MEVNRRSVVADEFGVHTATRSMWRRIGLVTQTLVITAAGVVVISSFAEDKHLDVNLSVACTVGIEVALVLKVRIRLRCQQGNRNA